MTHDPVIAVVCVGCVLLCEGLSQRREQGQTSVFAEGREHIMGPSGSGKTTLLDVLAGRKTVGTAEGTILFGGIAPTLKYLRRFTGYVEQFDTLLGILTVYEMLMYTAELKRPMHESLSRKQEEVEALMERLNLNVCRNVKIGSALVRGISGGQAKRVNIGIALITDPRILFLDEPTTGLDSFTSNEVMTLVKGLVRESGITCVSTIHSPTAYTFSLFDEVTMLVGGRLVWNGLGKLAMPLPCPQPWLSSLPTPTT
ncbi:ABC transporter domain-containing protein [Haematococcus lacustris]|uniref:ABC transporter domain-containing protein n=1 Tax=Haematococcus lacustris TaxID=44745 RepID=A0A699Z599_HAELA|nr:ABC transporter domain-containing protein [Haematococcus lacustris]